MNIISAITEQPIEFGINVEKIKLCHKLGLCKSSKMFKIKPITMGCLFDISTLIKKLEPAEATIEGFIEAILSNTDLLVRIVAIAVTNEQKPVNYIGKFFYNIKIKLLSSWIKRNTSSNEILGITKAVISKMDASHFFLTLASITGMDLVPNQTSGKA